jgi:DNA-binding CsgD family transcriptional regulator
MTASSSISSAAVERVASLFDQAPLEPARWDDALRALASLTGSARAQLVSVDNRSDFTSFDWISDDEGALRDQALTIGAYREQVNFRIAAGRRAPEMAVLDERDYDAARSQLAYERYVEFIERTDIPFGCQTSLLIDPDRFVGLAILKSRADGRTTADQRVLFAAIAPRVRAAMKLQILIEQQGRQLVLGAFDAISTKALLLDQAGRVHEMTPAADQLLSGTRRIWVRDGHIETPVPLETRRIAEAIHHAVEHRKSEATLLLPPLNESQHPLRLAIHATPRQPWNMGVIPAAIIVLQDGAVPANTRRARVMEQYELTPAEADIVVALAEGNSRSHIAQLRNVSIATIRTQLKTIYQKLGVAREAELVARAMILFGGA